MEKIPEESPMEPNPSDENLESKASKCLSNKEIQSTSTKDNQVLVFKGKSPDPNSKETYRAKFTFYPDRPAPSWSDQSIPLNNVAR